MRPRHPTLVVVGFANALAAAAAALPPGDPLATDPTVLWVVWAAAAFLAVETSLTPAGGQRATVATAILTGAAALAAAVEAVREWRWERPGVLLVFLVLGLLSLAPLTSGSASRGGGAYPTSEREVPPGQVQPRPALLRPVDERTEDLPAVPMARALVLGGRWRLEATPLARADRGGFSQVHLALDSWTPGRVVLVKLQSESPGVRAESGARLLRERDVLRRIASPHVVRLLDSGREERTGSIYLVLEYHPAGSLARWLEHRFVVDLRTVTEVGGGLLRGLAHLHEGLDRPVVHRDVSPRNALLRDRDAGGIVLIDLGSARRLGPSGPVGDLDITTGAVYSPFYAPPETVSGRHGRWGPPTDLYGVCAILYELVTGQPPYRRESRAWQLDYPTLVMDPGLHPRPARQLNPGLPLALDQLISAGLAHDPQDRPSRALDLVPLLEEVGWRHGDLRIPFADLRQGG
jgi:hypothetical protein